MSRMGDIMLWYFFKSKIGVTKREGVNYGLRNYEEMLGMNDGVWAFVILRCFSLKYFFEI